MESEVQQLVEMGATAAQARAALKRYKDVMQAAETIFSGDFDHVVDDDVRMDVVGNSPPKKSSRLITPEEDNESQEGSDFEMVDDDDDDGADDDDDDDEEAGYNDYDSDYEMKINAKKGGQAVDPYAEFWHIVRLTRRVCYLWVGSVESSARPRLSVCLRTFPPFALSFKPSFQMYTDALRTSVTRICPKCSQEVCMACGEGISPNDKKRASHQASYDPLFHCSDLQGIILGMGLYMIDRLYLEEVYGSAEGAPLKERSAKKRKVDDEEHPVYGPDGGRGKKRSGIGYDGQQKEDTTGQAEAIVAQTARDMRIGSLMSQVRVYLPSLQREGGSHSSDYLVSPTALAHLRRRFNTVASSLLRNDSLTDMSDRSVLYFELFSWLQTISNHEALASMVAMPIMIPSSSTIVNASGLGQRRFRGRRVIYEGSAGPRELMESLVIQATAAKKGLEGTKNDSANAEMEEMTEEQKRVTSLTARTEKGKGKDRNPYTEENLKLLSFCDRILATANAIDRSLRETKGDAFVERMYASLPRIPGRAKPQANESSSSVFESTSYVAPEGNDPAHPALSPTASDEEIVRVYEEWATATRFEYCDLTVKPSAAVLAAREQRGQEGREDEPPSYMTVFNQEARMLTHSDIPKRSLAIAKELAVLTTNLPVAWNSSVFLRVDETRVDIIKALITGPEGTPYYNGCYLFDIFLGPSYNTSPPNVKYITTNSGRFRFNPNLYADGKVCLSLLGTWSGPGWSPGKSTLLQRVLFKVLISIQSMILCDEPYLNEPGWANGGGSPASIAYSANVRRMVVHTAMLGNIKNPPEPWKDIILTHFRLKAKSITKQLDEWLKIDDGKVLSGTGAAYVPGNGASGNQSAGPSGNGFRNNVEELKSLLAALSRGEDITTRASASQANALTPSGTAAASQTNLNTGAIGTPIADDDGIEYD
ncbi:hypothetical protein FRB99_006183 [Tulasnella sp. 403]|nr:hypothetical protein FRB99_006183 [Tulasnella sp. 403]